MALNEKQQRFVAEYLIDLNATQAAIRAGYSQRTAGSQGFDLLKKPEIQEGIAAAQKERERRTEITQDRVLREIARIAFFDIRSLYREAGGGMKDPHELDDDAAAALVGVDVVEERERGGEGGKGEVVAYVKKAKIADKVSALTLAARHLGMLKERLEHSGPNGGPIETRRARDLTDEELVAELARHGIEP